MDEKTGSPSYRDARTYLKRKCTIECLFYFIIIHKIKRKKRREREGERERERENERQRLF